MTGQFRLDFIGIGCASSGTTWLYRQLVCHPQICMSRRKEIFYFCDNPRWGAMSYRFRGQKWLKQQFAHSRLGQICGEITAVYIHAPESAALIAQDMPHAKLIVILRDPVDRLYSFYYLLRRIYPLPDCFDDFIKKHPEYVEKSLYYKQLSRYYE